MRRGVGAVALAALLALAACTGVDADPSVLPPSGSPAASGVPRSSAESLEPAFARFRESVGGDLALAWAPVGRPEQVQVLGSVPDVDAWSLVRAPIAVAAADSRSPADTATIELIDAAIADPGTSATSALWRGLGPEPADAVEESLRAAGDHRTSVARDAAGRRVAVTRTAWRVEDSVRFAARLPCLPAAAPVLRAMGRIPPEQRYGVGRLGGSAVATGGGEGEHGTLVRQIGVVTRASDGQAVALALASRPTAGTVTAGREVLTAAAVWIQGRLVPADLGRCGSG